MTPSFPRSVALINPLGDFGIDTYTHELALGLAANGVRVDVYTSDTSRLRVPSQPNYRRFHVIGSHLPAVLEDATGRRPPATALSRLSNPAAIVGMQPPRPAWWKALLRKYYLPAQLAFRLKREKYDIVWTQWPDLGANEGFWQWSRLLGIPVVHTVHNILPHERTEGDKLAADTAYRTAQVLFVHSTAVSNEFAEVFPTYARKAVVIPHGTYTIYPRLREARARLRAELAIAPEQVVLLICGGIRPYKNVNACISAVAALDRDDVVLIIAGSEPGASPGNPLADITRRVEAAGIQSRVRLLPGYRDEAGIAEVFEASDVLLLPYLKSYGSGLLMLGITFGKYVLATRSGMEESVSAYPRGILLDGSSPSNIMGGILVAAARVRADPGPLDTISPTLKWDCIASSCMEACRNRHPDV